jgi:hypothetical protein
MESFCWDNPCFFAEIATIWEIPALGTSCFLLMIGYGIFSTIGVQ